MEKAFNPFFTTKEIGKGSGMGLSMVYGFVKQSNGHIKLYSEVGHGTTVKIYLPRTGASPTARRTEKEQPQRYSEVRKAQIVLVVEDNKDVLKLTSGMVKSLGFTVLTASTGEEALEIVKSRNDITLLMTDVMLPGAINGPALAAQALEIYPDLRVLFNSGYAEHAIFQSGLLKEGVHLIGKPFRKQQLGEKINEVLKEGT